MCPCLFVVLFPSFSRSLCHQQQRIKHARRRLFFSSLYLGKEEQAVIDALHDALSKNPQLTFHYIADYLRSTREAPSTCSASLLAPLKSAFPDRVHLGFWHTPELNGLTKTLVPHRFNEGWGLWHAKIYGADDDVIFSGWVQVSPRSRMGLSPLYSANLSKDYFTNRQDRYISFSQPDFADYAQAVIQVGQAMSYQLQSTDGSSFDLTWNTDSKGHLPEPTGPRVLEYKAQAREMWRDLQAHWASRPREKTTASEDDVEIRPFLQMGSFGVREETDLVVPYLLGMGSKQGVKTLDLTSGYFSLDSTNQMRVLETPAEDINVICASPQVNFPS